MSTSTHSKQQARASGTGVCCCIEVQQMFRVHSSGGSLYCMKWCYGCHVESVFSNWK